VGAQFQAHRKTSWHVFFDNGRGGRHGFGPNQAEPLFLNYEKRSDNWGPGVYNKSSTGPIPDFPDCGLRNNTFVLHKVWKHAFPWIFPGIGIELRICWRYTPVGIYGVK